MSRRAQVWCAMAAGGLLCGALVGAEPEKAPFRPLDPLAQSVVDSLDARPRTTPAERLDAAIRAAEVDARDAAARYFADLVDALRDVDDAARPGVE